MGLLMPTTALRLYVAPPILTPLPFGLLSVAQPAEESDAHWRNGVQFQPPLCDASDVTLMDCPEVPISGTGKAPTSIGIVTRGADAFTVYSWIDCSTVGFSNDEAAARTTEALINGEARAVEREFWTGEHGVMPHLAADTPVSDGDVELQTSATVLTSAAVDIVEALGLLEGALGACYGGIGTLHVPRQALAHMFPFWQAERSGQRLTSMSGTLINAGGGNPGTAPDGTLPGSSSFYLYATGAVKYWRSEIETTTQPSQVIDRSKNSVVMIAERTYAIGWDCCVAAGSIVHTANRGPVVIEQVQPGDAVWAWDDGRMKPSRVTATIPKGDREVLRIRTGSRSVDVTPDHRMLALRRQADTRPALWAPEWIEAGDLAEGDLLMAMNSTPEMSTTQRYLSDGTALDADTAWFLGAFVADGSMTSNGASICVYGEAAARVKLVAESVWGATCRLSHHHGVRINSVALRDVLADLELNRRSTERRVPNIVRSGSHKIIAAFLAGYGEGDGNWNPDKNMMRYACANRELLVDARALHMVIGDDVSNLRTEQRRSLPIIRGRQVKTALPLHWMRAYPGGRIKNRGQWDRYPGAAASLLDDHFNLDRIHSIDYADTAPVFDLSIEGTHNFMADGLVVHNCHFAAEVQLGGVMVGTPG